MCTYELSIHNQVIAAIVVEHRVPLALKGKLYRYTENPKQNVPLAIYLLGHCTTVSGFFICTGV